MTGTDDGRELARARIKQTLARAGMCLAAAHFHEATAAQILADLQVALTLKYAGQPMPPEALDALARSLEDLEEATGDLVEQDVEGSDGMKAPQDAPQRVRERLSEMAREGLITADQALRWWQEHSGTGDGTTGA